MLKPIVEIYPVMPAKDEAEREALRPIGRNAKIFQEVMEGWTEIIVEADRLIGDAAGFFNLAARGDFNWPVPCQRAQVDQKAGGCQHAMDFIQGMDHALMRNSSE